jgi:hypothetical protein
MTENPRALISAANKVVEQCEHHLQVAVEFVDDLPRILDEVHAHIAAAEERRRLAEERWGRARVEGQSRERKEQLRREAGRAWAELSRATEALGRDELHPEYRKGVARQMAGLKREDAEERLRAIADRSDDPEVQETVSICKEEVARTTRSHMKRFAEIRPLQSDEVRKARTEASDILEHLRNPPDDE